MDAAPCHSSVFIGCFVPSPASGPTMPKRPVRLLAPWVRLVREPSLTPLDGAVVRGPENVAAAIQSRLATEEVEVFLLVALDSQSRIRAVSEITRGILNSSLVHPREVFRVAIALGASGVILAHNHPSGDTTPSLDDQAVTRQLVAAGELLQIPVYDHLILGGELRFTSMASAGLL